MSKTFALDASNKGCGICYGDRLSASGRQVGLQIARSPTLQRESGFILVEMFAGYGGTRLATDLLYVRILARVVIECDKDAVKVVQREHPGVVVHLGIQEI